MENKIIRLTSGSEICGFCGEKINFDWNYCPNCKGKLEKKRCSFCQSIVNVSWKYCPTCKNSLIENKADNSDALKSGNDWLRNMLGD